MTADPMMRWPTEGAISMVVLEVTISAYATMNGEICGFCDALACSWRGETLAVSDTIANKVVKNVTNSQRRGKQGKGLVGSNPGHERPVSTDVKPCITAGETLSLVGLLLQLPASSARTLNVRGSKLQLPRVVSLVHLLDSTDAHQAN